MVKKVFQILLVVGCLAAMLLVGGCSFLWWGTGQAAPRNANIKIDLTSSHQDKLKQIETRVYRFVHLKYPTYYIDVTITDDGVKRESRLRFQFFFSLGRVSDFSSYIELLQEITSQSKTLPKYAVVD